jgi:hypothetical protein
MMMCVIPFVGRDELLLGSLQVSDGPAGMATKLDSAVGRLGLMNVLNRHFRGAIGIPQIGMMDLICESRCRYENCAQRTNDNLLHDFPFQL